MGRFWESVKALDPLNALFDLVEGRPMGIPENHPAIVAAKQRGLVAPEPATPARERPTLVASSHVPGTAAWVIGVPVPSLANERQWQARNRIAQAHRKAVSRALGAALPDLAPIGAHFHRGGTVRVMLTRLGGRALDRHDNLPAACKYVLDGVCLLLGADDADVRLAVSYGQEPGGSSGVRIELTEG